MNISGTNTWKQIRDSHNQQTELNADMKICKWDKRKAFSSERVLLTDHTWMSMHCNCDNDKSTAIEPEHGSACTVVAERAVIPCQAADYKVVFYYHPKLNCKYLSWDVCTFYPDDDEPKTLMLLWATNYHHSCCSYCCSSGCLHKPNTFTFPTEIAECPELSVIMTAAAFALIEPIK